MLAVIPLFRQTRSEKSDLLFVSNRNILIGGGISSGILLFAGSYFQQTGLVYTTAGKAGFVTGLYVILVPMIGLFWKQVTSAGTWIGAVLAVAGLWLLCIKKGFLLDPGDALVLISAFFWALHVLAIGWLTNHIHPLKLAVIQFFTCALLSCAGALLFESIQLQGILQAGDAILYAGLVSVGIAYTVQIVAQQHAHPSHAAIIMSLEAVFAVIGGWLFLAEKLSLRDFTGCVLMLAGMLVSQLWGSAEKNLLNRFFEVSPLKQSKK